MKSTVAYYLIILYSIAVCKPIIPVVADFLGHALWHQKHITTIHHENGKDHLHYELLEEKKEGDKPSTTIKSSEPVSVHIALEGGPLISNIFPASLKQTNNSYYTPSPIIELVLPPPRL